LGQDFQVTFWIGLDWIHELMDCIGLGQQKLTHVRLWIRQLSRRSQQQSRDHRHAALPYTVVFRGL